MSETVLCQKNEIQEEGVRLLQLLPLPEYVTENWKNGILCGTVPESPPVSRPIQDTPYCEPVQTIQAEIMDCPTGHLERPKTLYVIIQKGENSTGYYFLTFPTFTGTTKGEWRQAETDVQSGKWAMVFCGQDGHLVDTLALPFKLVPIPVYMNGQDRSGLTLARYTYAEYEEMGFVFR